MKTNSKNWIKVSEGHVLVGDGEIIPKDFCLYENIIVRATTNNKVYKENRAEILNKYAKKILGSTFPLEGVPLIVLQDNLERMFKLGYRAAKNGAYTSNGTYQEDLEKALKSLDVLEFATVITGQCNCECHTPGNMVMHMQACCHPKETLDVVPHPTHSAGQLTTIVR